MTMLSDKRRVLQACVLAFLGVGVLIPWKSLIETKLKERLAASGYRNVELTVSDLGPTGIALENIAIGDAAPLHLGKLTLGYSFSSLIHGSAQDVVLTGLDLNLIKQGGEWTIAGAPLAQTAPGPKAQTAIPVSADDLNAEPFSKVTIADSTLHIANGDLSVDLPFNLSWDKTKAKLAWDAHAISVKFGHMTVTAGKAYLNAALRTSQKQWSGDWQMNDIRLAGLGEGTYAAIGHGTVNADGDRLTLKGQLTDSDPSEHLIFELNYVPHDLKRSSLHIAEGALKWNGGTASIGAFDIPFTNDQPIRLNVKLDHVGLEPLLRQLTGKPIAASGSLSGSIPVTLSPTGDIALGHGDLEAVETGTIMIPPEIIPGDNPQVELTRDILKNFHYSLLSVTIDQDPEQRLSLLLKLNGANPDIAKGRPVNLTVHLAGDVLDFIKKNLTILNDPKALLQQGQHETP